MRNLVIGVVGDNSLHGSWWDGKDFDLFLVYYSHMGERYKDSCTYYAKYKGTKFLIVDQLYRDHKEIIDQYDAIWVPDDDIYMEVADVKKFFEIFHEYKLQLAQPGILGWGCIPITFAQPGIKLRYTNYVEIMAPCFSKEAFSVCAGSFAENRTNWGIDLLWTKLLGDPQDKIAVVDGVVGIHTRPCFYGDTYYRNNNNFQFANQELEACLTKHGLDTRKVCYGSVPLSHEEFDDLPSEQKCFPNNAILKKLITSLRS